jgi:hypothetical protein
MSETNGSGIIRIGKKGLRKFTFDEDADAFEIDVIAAQAQWLELDRQFRDDNNEVPPDKLIALNEEARRFAMELAYDTKPKRILSIAEALEFLKLLNEEAGRLADFFTPKDSEVPSSRESSELRFTT